MILRPMLFSLAAAMLYLGPFVAGLSDAPTLFLPVFVALFMLWTALMRPAVWARVTRDGTPVALAVHLGGLTLMQVLFVIVAFGFGRGLTAMVGTLELSPWKPLALTVLALPLGRLLWNTSSDRAEADAFLSGAGTATGGRDGAGSQGR